jgi:hypothetical protein
MYRKTILASVMLFLTATAAHAGNTLSTKSVNFQGTLDSDAITQLFSSATAQEYPALTASGSRNDRQLYSLSARYTNTDVTIYDVCTSLIDDINYDGYFRQFSVTFDADTLYPEAYLYAKLYISYEGGPWNLYTITDNFTIHGDSEYDDFTVETELAEGFEPGYYDIKIELYDAYTDAFILDYGPYQDTSLSALPLEDSYHDDMYYDTGSYTETQVIIDSTGHGAFGFWLLIVPFLFLFRKYQGKRGGTSG